MPTYEYCAAKYGLTQADPSFDPACDVVRDGVIDTEDLLALAGAPPKYPYGYVIEWKWHTIDVLLFSAINESKIKQTIYDTVMDTFEAQMLKEEDVEARVSSVDTTLTVTQLPTPPGVPGIPGVIEPAKVYAVTGVTKIRFRTMQNLEKSPIGLGLTIVIVALSTVIIAALLAFTGLGEVVTEFLKITGKVADFLITPLDGGLPPIIPIAGGIILLILLFYLGKRRR